MNSTGASNPESDSLQKRTTPLMPASPSAVFSLEQVTEAAGPWNRAMSLVNPSSSPLQCLKHQSQLTFPKRGQQLAFPEVSPYIWVDVWHVGPHQLCSLDTSSSHWVPIQSADPVCQIFLDF